MNLLPVVLKAGSDCCKMPSKITEEDEDGEATPSLADAEENSMEAAVTAVLLQLGGIFTLVEEQRTALKVFCCITDFFLLLNSQLTLARAELKTDKLINSIPYQRSIHYSEHAGFIVNLCILQPHRHTKK